MEILKISEPYVNLSMNSSDGTEIGMKGSLLWDPFTTIADHAEKDEHFEVCERFNALSDEEMAELEQWRLEMLLALEYCRNPPKDPEDY